MKKIISIIIAVLLPLLAIAQTQQGYVKSLGRPGKPGVPLSGVTVRFKGSVSPVVSGKNGTFSINMPGKKDGDAISLSSVRKNGYELKDAGMIGRNLVFSTKTSVEIVLVNKQQLAADRKRIEDNAYRVANDNYKKKLNKLESQLKQKEISAEKYRNELQSLQNQYEKYLSLISDMADRYARTDYDKLDSIDYQINICIEEGELDKADSLIHTVFDPETVLDRNQKAKAEIEERIKFAQQVITHAKANKEAIMRDNDYALRVSVLSENLATEYLPQGKKDDAIKCLNYAIEIKELLFGEDSKPVLDLKKKLEEINSDSTN
ncbi:MAG: hypothetical protein IKL11_02675 [Muribaculaceae bacterium]|nr:hypothetical protein [Muribaculaceae bacterium]